MDTIVTDIWNEVFALACTDDGRKGRALSLVSRDIHHLSKPLKYQSISVVGIRQLEKLLAVFDQLPAAERRVKSLFVGNLDGDRDGPKDWHGELEECSSSVEQALNQLLNLVSSSLLVLHIHRIEVYRPSLFPEVDLPVLAELVLQGSFKLSQPHDKVRPRTFPSLRRLEIRHLYSCRTSLRHVVDAAPNLVHMRIPQRSLSLMGIKVALEMMPATPEAGPEAVYLPGSLRKLEIELPTFNPSLGSPFSAIRQGQELATWRALGKSDGRVSFVSAFNDGWTEYYIPIEVAKEEWLMT